MKIKFGTSGWRGIISDDFTFENVRAVAQAIADHLKDTGKTSKGVIVARDTRFMTERYVTVIAEVLTGNGIRVFMPEKPTPTPVVSHTIMKMSLDGGINVTASHNPPEYCGIKFNPDSAGPALPDVTEDIEAKIEEVKSGKRKIVRMDLKDAASKGLFEIIDPLQDYISALSKIVDFDRIRRAGLKIVADVMFGAAMGYLDNLVRELSADYEILHDYRDPYFGGERPEPDENRMRILGNTVGDKRWDIGIAVDGDADRFGIVDDTGDFVKPNEVIALLAHHLFENKGLRGPVARSIATSHALDSVAKTFGEDTIETPVGFKFLGPLIIERNVVIAGEESGGLSIQGHTPEKDGILADLLVLEMIAYEGKRLSEIRKDFKEKYGEFHNTRLDLELEDLSRKDEIMEKFRHIGNEFGGFKVTYRDEIDGVRYFLSAPNTWFLARPSGTEPVIRVYVESTDLKIFRRVATEVKKMIRE